MIVVTHESRSPAEAADEVVFMDDGAVVETGPPERILKSPEHERTRQFLARVLRMTPISPRYLMQFSEPAGYLDFARFGPPSHAVLDTTARLLERATHAGPATVDELMREEPGAKAAAARLCRSDVDHVVLQPHTSLGLLQAAFNAAGGTVLVSAAEFPANTYPWARAEQAGRLTMRRLPGGYVTADRIAEALTDEITIVSVSAVDYRTGYRADLAALRDAVGDRILVVDGIQGFGVIEAPWEVADILVVGGQKWLRSGWGTGFAVLSDRALERMDPVLSGWTGARDPGLFDDEIHPADTTAAAWSISNLSPVTSGAFAAGLELVEETGVDVIAAHVAERVAELEEVLLSRGAQIVSARRAACRHSARRPSRSTRRADGCRPDGGGNSDRGFSRNTFGSRPT